MLHNILLKLQDLKQVEISLFTNIKMIEHLAFC